MREVFSSGIKCLFCLIFSQGIHAQTFISSESKRSLDLIQHHLTREDGVQELINQSNLPIIKINGEVYLSMLARTSEVFKEKDLPKEVFLSSRLGRTASLKVPLHSIQDLRKCPNILELEVSPHISPDLRRAIQDTRADSLHRGLINETPYTGKNVIVGVTDWGFDYTHPMFYDSNLTETRILAVWDQSRNSGPSPVAFGYGTELKGEVDLLNVKADSATTFYSYATHGTHVAGIAGGGGAGIGLYGMAPECNFLFSQIFLDVASTLDAVTWMKDYAKKEGKRLVINMSWGLYQLGPLDGTSIISEAFDALTDSGVVVVTSNGNNGSRNLHIKKSFSGDTITSRVGMNISSNPNSWGQNIIMWGSKNSSFSAGFDVYKSGNLEASGPYFSTLGSKANIDSILVVGTDTIIYTVDRDSIHPANDCPHMSLKIRNRYSKYAIVLKSTSINSTVHFLNITHNLDHVANWGYDFTSYGPHAVAGDSEYTVGEPACAKKVISVGAHSSELRLPFDTIPGNIAQFSSRGPTQDDRTKPEITAPGSNILSSINSFTDEAYTKAESVDFKGRTYDFAPFSGTSMSGPMVTGISALILEARKFATVEQVKEILIQSARMDEKTGSIPSTGSNTWGWGKATATAAVAKALDEVGIRESKNQYTLKIYPNPGKNLLRIQNINGSKVDGIEIRSLDGRFVKSCHDCQEINTESLSPGLYLVFVHQDQDQFVSRWIKN